MLKKTLLFVLLAVMLAGASLGLACAAGDGLALPDPTAFFAMEEGQARWEDGVLVFHLEGDASDVLCEYAELMLEEPYGYALKADPHTLRLGDSTSMSYSLRNPEQEDESIICGWAYFERVNMTRVAINCAADSEEDVVLQDCGSTASRSVKALDFDKGEALRDQATANSGSTSSSDSSASDWCISCGGSGQCNACGGSGRVYKTLPGTTKRVEQNCTSCYLPGKCRSCGGDGKK